MGIFSGAGFLPPNWGEKSRSMLDDEAEDDADLDLKLRVLPQFRCVDHPADYQIDYNSMIDFLEEEHMRREVFTTRRGRN